MKLAIDTLWPNQINLSLKLAIKLSPFLSQFTNLIQDKRLTVQELDRLAAIAGETIDRLNLKYQDEKKP